MKKVGDNLEIELNQASLMFGYPTKDIKAGTRGSWIGMDVEVIGVNGDAVQIKRLAADSLLLGDNSPIGKDDGFHELDVFDDGAAKETDRNGGLITKPILGPIDMKQLEPIDPGKPQGGDGMEKVDIIGPELKAPRDQVFPFSNPSLSKGEPAFHDTHRASYDPMEIINNIKKLRAAEGIDTPLIAVKKEF